MQNKIYFCLKKIIYVNLFIITYKIYLLLFIL